VIIQVEKLDSYLIEECNSILKRNYAESGHLVEDLEISWNSYLKIGDAFVAIIMRDGASKIQGILFFLVSPYSHVVSIKSAQQITFYIEKEHRFYCKAMIEFSESFFMNEGVDLIIQSSRYEDAFCGVLSNMGYTPSDLTFMKRIS